jgi:fructuronate reductase
MSYCGLLSGLKAIPEVIGDPIFAEAARRYMAEVRSTVPPAPGTDLASYERSVLERFGNTAILYASAQVASDGSLKLAQRAVPAIVERLSKGQPVPWLSLLVAAWMCCVADQNAQWPQPRDPQAGRLAEIARQVGSNAEHLARRYLEIESIFGPALARNQHFASTVAQDLKRIMDLGIRRVVEMCLAGQS